MIVVIFFQVTAVEPMQVDTARAFKPVSEQRPARQVNGLVGSVYVKSFTPE